MGTRAASEYLYIIFEVFQCFSRSIYRNTEKMLSFLLENTARKKKGESFVYLDFPLLRPSSCLHLELVPFFLPGCFLTSY